jgi:hypothetical protein
MNKIFYNIGFYAEKLATWYCINFHKGILFGGGDYYICAVCHRKFQTPWGKACSKH